MLKYLFSGFFLVSNFFWLGGDFASAQDLSRNVIPEIMPTIGLSKVTGQWGDAGSSLCIHDGEEFDTSDPERSICGRDGANALGDPVDTDSTKVNGYLIRLDVCGPESESQDGDCYDPEEKDYGITSYKSKKILPEVIGVAAITITSPEPRFVPAGIYMVGEPVLIGGFSIGDFGNYYYHYGYNIFGFREFTWVELGKGMGPFVWVHYNAERDGTDTGPDTQTVLDAFSDDLRSDDSLRDIRNSGGDTLSDARDVCLEENIHLRSLSGNGAYKYYGQIYCIQFETVEDHYIFDVTVIPEILAVPERIETIERAWRDKNPVPKLCRWETINGTTYSKCLMRDGTCRRFSLGSSLGSNGHEEVPCRS